MVFVTACASSCSYCATNGANKCDPSYCKTGYVYQPTTKTCAGKTNQFNLRNSYDLLLSGNVELNTVNKNFYI